MTIKTILIPFIEEEPASRLFDAALAWATFFHAHMRFVHLLQRPVLDTVYTYPTVMNYRKELYEELDEIAEEKAGTMEAAFHGLCEKAGVPVINPDEHSDGRGATASWRVLDRNMPYGYTYIARLADLILLAKPEEDAPPYQQGLAEEMLFQTGRPVVMVGAKEAMTAMPERVVLAWNGGREAARALSAALPVLKQARLVDVTTIGRINRDAESPEAVAAYLALHGIRAEASHLLLKRGGDPEEAFIEHAGRKKKADLVIMGAYSHNRWREVVLGGFTRQMMKESNMPVFMTH